MAKYRRSPKLNEDCADIEARSRLNNFTAHSPSFPARYAQENAATANTGAWVRLSPDSELRVARLGAHWLR